LFIGIGLVLFQQVSQLSPFIERRGSSLRWVWILLFFYFSNCFTFHSVYRYGTGTSIMNFFIVLIFVLNLRISTALQLIKVNKFQNQLTSLSLKKHTFDLSKSEVIQQNYSKNDRLLPPWFPSFVTACLGGLLFGLDIGSSSSVLRILGAGNSIEFGTLEPIQLGQIASASLFGAIISSSMIILIGDSKVGRKNELQIASVLFFLGTALESQSSSFPWAFSLLLLGRVLYGLGIGTAMHAAPLYIAETAPSALRGRLVSFKEAAIVGGIVAGYAAGALFGGGGAGGDWQSVFACALPFEAAMALGAFAVPESPRWLALRGRGEEAAGALALLQGLDPAEATEQVKQMTDMANLSQGEGKKEEEEDTLDKLKELVSSKYNQRALFIGIGLVLFQQVSRLSFCNTLSPSKEHEKAVGAAFRSLFRESHLRASGDGLRSRLDHRAVQAADDLHFRLPG
jgi:MFS family permease